MQPASIRKRRRYNLHRIRTRHSYTINEIVKLYGIHKNSVRHWIKDGLQTIDKHRPILIHGSDLKAYLAEKQGGRKQSCKQNELYCMKCRAPKTAWENVVDLHFQNEKTVRISALCNTCGTNINKLVSTTQIDIYKAIFTV